MKNFTKLTIGSTRHNICFLLLNLYAQFYCKYHKYLGKLQIIKPIEFYIFLQIINCNLQMQSEKLCHLSEPLQFISLSRDIRLGCH